MSRLKRSMLLLITILIMIGVCGCMSVEQDYKESIRNYLKEKYSCNFEVKQVVKEFNGFDGSYLRAICQSDTNEGDFEVFCYLDGERVGDKITIDESEYIICDHYVDIAFQNQLAQQLYDRIGQDVFVRCQIAFSNHFTTIEEYETGMKSCLEDPGLASHVVVYVVVNDTEKLATIREAVETSCLEYNAYRQYLYFATTSSEDFATISQHYGENTDTYDQHMEECEWIERVYFSLIKRDEGITMRSVEKE